MTGSSKAGRWRRVVLPVAVSTVSSGVISVVLLLVSRATATTSASLGSLAFGLPLPWATQDQSWFDPPSFPREASFASPWEHPTVVSPGLLLADLLIISAALWLLVVVGRWFSTRGRGLPPAR